MNVVNALFRLEMVSGTPPSPWEKPSESGDFWVLELSGRPEPLPEWQNRILPLVAQQRGLILSHVVNGAKAIMFVETDSDRPGPAVFGADLVDLLSDLSADLEHVVNQK